MRSSLFAASCSTSCLHASSRSVTSACSPTATAAGHWLSADSISTPPPPTAPSCSPNNSALRLTAPALGADPAPCTSSHATSLLNWAAPTHRVSPHTSTHPEGEMMPTCMPTRFLATTDSQSAHVAPRLESAPHSLDLPYSHPLHTASAPPHEPTLLTNVQFPAPSAASTPRKRHSIPIHPPP